MAVNMYDEAAPVQYVSQYVPIPFQELFAMAKYYGDEIKTARKELSDYAKSVGEFQSLLTKDVDSYHRIALNDNIRRVMDEAVANPNVMKNSAWRSSMASALNSVNYADLSKLKKSAEQADLYDKLYKSLAAQGKMPPGWEKDWYSTYDTLAENKIFDKTPLPYSSVEDVAYSYVDELKDTHLGSHGGYNWYGVDEDIALRQVRERESELLADPYVNRHYEILREAGLTDQEALQEIRNRANTAALRAVRMKPVVDPYAMAAYQAEAAMRLQGLKNAGKGKTGSGGVLGIEDVLTQDFKQRSQNIISGLINSDPVFNKKYTDLFTQNGIEINKRIEQLQQNPQFSQAFEKIYKQAVNAGYDEATSYNLALQQALNTVKESDPNIVNTINSLFAQTEQLQNAMTQEAYGRTYQQVFNNMLGVTRKDNGQIDENANPFAKVNTHKGKIADGMFFDDSRAQHMWSSAVETVMQPLSSVTEQEINKELFGKEVPKDSTGFTVSATKLISPKEFIYNSNSYVQSLANAAGFDVMGTRLNRGSIIGGNDNNISIEERLSSGDYGDVNVTEILGYVDTPENRNYVVRVELPINEDDSVFGEKMTHWLRNDDPVGVLAEAGYSIIPTENGHKASLIMVMPDTNLPLDKTRRNRSAQKQYGTNDSKNAQISQDDAALNLILNYNPQQGFE